MKNLVALVSVLCLALPFVCTISYAKEEQEVRTVSWFRDPENKTALEATRQQCRDNPGQLRDAPNCTNARKGCGRKFPQGWAI